MEMIFLKCFDQIEIARACPLLFSFKVIEYKEYNNNSISQWAQIMYFPVALAKLERRR